MVCKSVESDWRRLVFPTAVRGRRRKKWKALNEPWKCEPEGADLSRQGTQSDVKGMESIMSLLQSITSYNVCHHRLSVSAWLSVPHVSSTCGTLLWVQVNTHGTQEPLRGEAVGGQICPKTAPGTGSSSSLRTEVCNATANMQGRADHCALRSVVPYVRNSYL